MRFGELKSMVRVQYLTHGECTVHCYLLLLTLDKSNSVNFGFLIDKAIGLNNRMSKVFCSLQSLKIFALRAYLRGFHIMHRFPHMAGHMIIIPLFI